MLQKDVPMVRPAWRPRARSWLAPFCGLAVAALCALLFLLDLREAGRALDREAERVFAMAMVLAPGDLRGNEDGPLAAVLAAIIQTPPFAAARIVTNDGRIVAAGNKNAFDEPLGLVAPGYPYVRYASRIPRDGGQAFRLELLADTKPLAGLLLWRFALLTLASLGALWLGVAKKGALTDANGGNGALEARSSGPPEKRDTLPGEGRAEIREVMPLRLRPLAPLFVKTAFDNARRMRAALKREEFEELRRLGHSLKGAARTYGLMRLGERGLGLEQAAGEKDAAKIAGLLDELDDALSRTTVYFEEREETEDENGVSGRQDSI